MSPRRWIGRAVVGVLLVLVVVGVALYEHTTPHLIPLVLLVAAAIGVAGLMIDTASVAEPDWEVVGSYPVVPPGQDPGLTRNVRMLENHLTSRTVEPVLRSRLARLTDDRLAHVGLRRGDPGVDELLGPTLTDVLDSSPRRLGRLEVEECVKRIEELTNDDH